MKALLRRLLGLPAAPTRALTDIERARRLIAAIDAGGIPLDPQPIRRIAEGLGLEVSRRAPMDETIARIRAAVKRCPDG